jgi:hypothetical protein
VVASAIVSGRHPSIIANIIATSYSENRAALNIDLFDSTIDTTSIKGFTSTRVQSSRDSFNLLLVLVSTQYWYRAVILK